MTSRLAIAVMATLALALPAMAEETYNVSAWPQGIKEVPCTAWKHNPDGSWTLQGTIRAGGITMTGVRFAGTGEAKTLDRKCGNSN
jgi:hypothetical protein